MVKIQREAKSTKEFDTLPKPFLRWAGGKRRLTELLTNSFPKSYDFEKSRYFEPFIGGGALMFALGNQDSEYFIPGKNISINDVNPDLIASYRVIKTDVDSLIRKLEKYSKDTSKEAFERMRMKLPVDDVSRAARFIYLNKTCFNGLWRVNSKGEFNVPWGKLKTPLVFSRENLLACSRRLKGSKISCNDFASAVRSAKEGDLVYFDPPYLPLSSSSNFSKYAKADFTIPDHEKLSKLIEELTSRGVFVILSNSDTTLSRQMFDSVLTLRQIPMNRSISASSTSRKSVMELLGMNFDVDASSPLSKMKSINIFQGALE
jgi:DNA adenine methylase